MAFLFQNRQKTIEQVCEKITRSTLDVKIFNLSFNNNILYLKAYEYQARVQLFAVCWGNHEEKKFEAENLVSDSLYLKNLAG